MAFSPKDIEYMEIALKEAEKGRGFTKTNPLVGAVVVKDDQIVSVGYHAYKGAEHAEAMAIRIAGESAVGADLYVTLEPCSHWGENPPCTDIIIKSGISRVVVAVRDPNPLVRQSDPEILMKNNNIIIEYGCCEEKAQVQNEAFLKYIKTGLPFITMKTAMTLDGKIATRTGDSKWVSSESSRKHVHLLRGISDAVMIGAGTLRADDPSLTIREIENTEGYEQPYRIILSISGNVPLSSKVFNDEFSSKTILVTSEFPDENVQMKLHEKGVKIIVSDLSSDVFKQIASEYSIANILLESGGQIGWSLIEGNYVDKFTFFIAPKICGGTSAISPVAGLGVACMSDSYNLKFSSVKLEEYDVVINGYFS